MKTLYLDLFSGISGDMFIAALIDLGVEARQLEQELKKLRLEGYHLHVARGHKASLEGVKFDVHLSSDHDHEEESHAHGHTHSHSHAHPHEHGRTFAQIRQLITESQLSDWVKQKAVAVFQRIAVAEGKIHGLPPDQVAFHEVGAVDSIIDIVGACIALEMLGKPRVLASPVVEGTGWIDCAHGRLPDSRSRDARDSGRARHSPVAMRRAERTGHAHGGGAAGGVGGDLRPHAGGGGGEDRLWPGHPRQPDAAQCAAGRAWGGERRGPRGGRRSGGA